MQLFQHPLPRPAAGDPMRCDEGRASEASRQATRRLLFTRRGWPGPWLLVLAACWIAVAVGGWKLHEDTRAAQRQQCEAIQAADASLPPAERRACPQGGATQRRPRAG